MENRDERRSSMKECRYGARSRSEDDETLIKVNELPELPGSPPVTLCQETERGERGGGGGGGEI